mmetsp:Transcript_2968/g.4364  ORF Transcript_2968/g.4364 Transcript_2968/m.4364 type:complete len:186 (-) Transcript_2968:94-651(-)|eukprot:CAMPEP_0194199370 /NCGR_PEP_ID=MMETSP0156-20130528/416_1 /TAXON_ID=33649 /ORGANISM="Thalassionema nitzschioides, Strain L26-B" /LENGTH=185 /DNA_ID=CAMNT_0038924255 /DNA_START=57 /DNA_END=614 /DNA_ORIENTATION=-
MKFSLLALALSPLFATAVKNKNVRHDRRLKTQKKQGSSDSGSSSSCGAANLVGTYTYMATTGVNGGKAYNVAVNYDEGADEGLVVLFANGLNDGSLLTLREDDSVFLRFKQSDNFKVVDGECTFSFPEGVEMKCPLLTDKVEGEEGEASEPNCGFGFKGIQIDANTWSLDFPPFPTGAPRLMVKN